MTNKNRTITPRAIAIAAIRGYKPTNEKGIARLTKEAKEGLGIENPSAEQIVEYHASNFEQLSRLDAPGLHELAKEGAISLVDISKQQGAVFNAILTEQPISQQLPETNTKKTRGKNKATRQRQANSHRSYITVSTGKNVSIFLEPEFIEAAKRVQPVDANRIEWFKKVINANADMNPTAALRVAIVKAIVTVLLDRVN